MKRLSLVILFILCTRLAPGQKISLYFPHFAGAEYDFYLFLGSRNDTIQKGTIPDDGRVTLTVPNGRIQYAPTDYRGMACWMLKAGGGLDFVINGEDFSVSCLEALPDENTIIYSGSTENDFLHGGFIRRQSVFKKIDALRILGDAYSDENAGQLALQVKKELKKQTLRFDSITRETIESPLYAARYRRISDFYNGLPLYQLYSSDGAGREQYLAERRRFIEEELNMDVLYTTGLWNGVISQTFELYDEKKDFASAMIRNLGRTGSQRVYEQLATDLTTICEQFDWPEAQTMIIDYLVASDRIVHPNPHLTTVLSMHKTRVGTKAPSLSRRGVLPTPVQNGRIHTPAKTILLFYETGCGPCENEIQELKSHYPMFAEKGYRVISISADNDEQIFRNTASRFPWEEKYCDLQGFEGEDFKNWGIIGTPTIFVTDEEGIIRGRYARVGELRIFN